MYGHHPRDWSRIEREMRVWGRRFERDMRAMGERIEADMKASGQTHRRGWGGWCGPGSAWVMGADWDCGARAGRREARRAVRAARRTGREAAREVGRHAAWGGFFACWWWLVFPLFFLGRNAWRDAGGWSGIGGAFEGLVSWTLNFTLAAPPARLIERAMQVSFTEAFMLLALAAAVSAGAAAIGWRAGRPREGRRAL
jgi:hypothetical protein